MPRPDTINPELAQDVRDRIASQTNRPVGEVGLDTPLADLVVDSIDVIEIAIELEEEHDVWFEDTDLDRITTIADLVALVEERMTSAVRP